ncbi:MAG: hypothetical protein ACI93N_002176 [Flavobacteriaceae bacterium]|jgi:hypothetical protein
MLYIKKKSIIILSSILLINLLFLFLYRFGHIIDIRDNIFSYLNNPVKYRYYLNKKSENNYPLYKLDIVKERMKGIEFQRNEWIYSWDNLILNKQWNTRTDFYTKAKLLNDTNVYKIDVKLFGLNRDHIVDSKYWSFRVKSKKFYSKFGNTKFNLLRPKTRMYLSDILCNQIFKKLGLIYLEYTPINLSINGSLTDIYFIEDHFSKYIIERSKRRESFLFSSDGIKVPKKINSTDSVRFTTIKNRMENQPQNIFDYEKFYSFISLAYITQNLHSSAGGNMHYYYNPISDKVEPLIRETRFESLTQIESYTSLQQDILLFLHKLNRMPMAEMFIKSISNDSIQLQKLSNEVLKINLLISQIIEQDNWGKLEDAIYSKHPGAMYESINIYKNNIILNNITPRKLKTDKENIFQIIEGNLKMDKDILLNNGNLIIKPNSRINLNGHNIILNNGAIIADGSNGKILISNSSGNTSSIISKNGVKNIFNNVSITDISNYDKGAWKIPSAITFYNTNVSINNCNFSNNRRGDDFLNIYMCDSFLIKNTVFSNIIADAFDSDFSNGNVTNCKFINIGNDAIDGSESKINITNSYFDIIFDKAITCGEKSNFHIENCEITNAELAFVSKDGSIVSERNNLLSNNTVDYCVFRKKKQFDLGKLFTDKDISKYKYLIQKESIVLENNELATDLKRHNDIELLLYGTLFGKKTIN